MLIIRTPFRISFFGGGTDFFDYFSEYGGCVLSTTIDKYCYVSMRHLPPLFGYESQVTYSKIERFSEVDDIEHPLVRAALKYIPVDRIQIAYDADLPACSGIGSSSAFAVALLQGLHAIKGEKPDKMSLAKEAIYLERDYLNEAGGVQDQIASAFGGFNRLDFSANGFNVTPLEISPMVKETLQNNLFLTFTGFTRFSSDVAVEQKKNISSTRRQLDEMKSLVSVAENFLKQGKTDDFGRLLDYTWDLKKSLSKGITNPEIDELYECAKKNGAIGGKVLGAGGGGFMLLYVPFKNRERFIEKTKGSNIIPFGFENKGTEIIYSDDLFGNFK